MVGQILVPLRRSDHVELFLPYIEQIAQPGVKVVFLVQIGGGGFQKLGGELLSMHTGIRSSYLLGTMCEEDAVEKRRALAERQVYPACRSLRQRGVQVEVHGYEGSPQRIVRRYLGKENVQLVMMRPSSHWLVDAVRMIASACRFWNPPIAAPVLLLYPSNLGR
jgi:hypothetical protein